MKKLLITALLAAASSALAVGAPAGAQISNTGLFEYTDETGTPTTTPTTPVVITVSAQYDPEVTPNGTVANPGQTQTALPGQTATLTYDVTNKGNAIDTLNLTVTDAQDPTNPPLPSTVYLDDGDGVYDAGDTVVTSLKDVPADETRRVFVRYTEPANAPGNQQTYVNLTATSAGDTTQKDDDNVGLITATSIVNFTLDSDNTLTTTPTGTVTASHTLTNTGNATIVASTLEATATLTDAGAASDSISYTVKNNATGAQVSNADLETALRAAGDLPAGGTYTIAVSYKGAANADNGEVFTNVLSVYSNAADATGFDNRVEQNQAVSDTDTVTVNRGVASVSKTADNCGTDATCANPVLNTTTAKPGDYIRYTVTVTNTGGSALRFPTLRDYVPANTTFASVTGSSTQTGAAIVYSNDRSNWFASAPSALATSTTDTSGPFVYVGLDSSGDTDVTTADSLAPGQTLRLVITVRVRATGNSN